MTRIGRILTWVQRHERHLSSVFFVGGFVTDLITYILLPVTYANYVFLIFLGLAGACTIGSHTLSTHFPKTGSWFSRSLHFIFPLGAQYFIGGLLSGFMIFYTKSAVVFVSWPFLLLLLVVFLGNEVFRGYREHLAFQTVLFFFAIYAYLIFAVPLLLHDLGPRVFLISTGAAVATFALLLLILAGLGWERLKKTLGMIVVGSLTLVTFVVGSYFTGFVPPIPLTLQESGVYHRLTWNSAGNYVVAGEAKRWWEPTVIHHVPGTPLYVYSSVFAPVSFSLTIAHVWQRYDEETKEWRTESRIEFPVRGGRMEGYRGYSEKSSVPPGEWQVLVETKNGQVIGRIRFTVVETDTVPPLTEELK